MSVTWEQIRAQYAQAFHAARQRGETQTTVALRGGLQGPHTHKPQQHQISKILSSHHSRSRGPSVETFVRAVEGLGISVSSFFEAIERGESQTLLDQIATRRTDADDLLAEAARHLRRVVKLLEEARHLPR